MFEKTNGEMVVMAEVKYSGLIKACGLISVPAANHNNSENVPLLCAN